MPLTHHLRRCAAASFFIAGGAWSQDSPAPAEPRNWLQLYGTAARWTMQTSEGGSGFSETRLQAETELGLPRRGSILGLGYGRLIGQHWRFELGYEASRREGTGVLTNDVVSAGVRYASGSTVRSEIGLKTLRINAGRSVLTTEHSELGLLLGGQWFRVSQRFEGQGELLNTVPPTPVGPYTTSSRDLAPLGLLGLYGSHALSPDWRLNARAEFGLGGGYRHGVVSAQWRALPNLALGAGYRYSRAELDVVFGFIACCSRLLLDYRTHGPTFTADLLF